MGVMSITFVNGQHGWVFASQQSGNQLIGTLYATSDGGKSWRKIMQNIITTHPQTYKEGKMGLFAESR